MRLSQALALALLAPTSVAAQGTQTQWIDDTIHSQALGERELYIVLPDGYASGTRRYPVLVCLDADDSTMFRLWIAQAAYVADNDLGVPPIIVVGIVNGKDRIHDMTPQPTGSSVAQFPNGGGADAFADFVTNDVLPLIHRKYRTLQTTILAGHSAGGLFALDVSATKPGVFQGIIALSPAIWYNDARPAVEFADAIGHASTRQRIFVANGGVDEGRIDTATQRFYHLLDSLQPAATAYRRYSDERHAETPLGFADGFRFIFDRVSVRRLPIYAIDFSSADSATIVGALAGSERAYADGAHDLLLPEQLPEEILNNFGYRLLSHHQIGLAVSVFRQNVDRYPQSINVYDSYADGLIAVGDTVAAVKELQQAVEVGRRTGIPVPTQTRSKLAVLTGKKRH